MNEWQPGATGTVNPAQPIGGVELCRLDRIGDPGSLGLVFSLGESWFAGFLVRADGRVTGYVDRCPHVGTPLSLSTTGYLTRAGEAIICSTHGALFELKDGLCVAGPCVGRRLSPWSVVVRGGVVIAA